MANPQHFQQEIALVGLGQRSLHMALDRICTSPFFRLVAICDPDETVSRHVQALHPNVRSFASVDELLEHHKKTEVNQRIKCAYVSVPHSQYALVVPALLRERIHVLKEKPAGTTSAELKICQDLADHHDTRLVTASQSRYGMRWSQLSQWLPLIGTVCLIEGTLKIAVPDLAQGWRANKRLAGGGAVNDIGWHLIDNVLGIVGLEFADMSLPYSKLFKTRDSQAYDCEDSAHVIVELRGLENKQPVVCNLRISRNGLDKLDEITVVGGEGVIVAHNDEIRLSVHQGPSQQLRQVAAPSHGDFDRMLHCFHAEVMLDAPSAKYQALCLQDAQVTKTVDAIYSAHDRNTVHATGPTPYGTKPSLLQCENPSLGRRLQWPRITPDVTKEVLSQLHRAISIDDNGGIFRDFETEFKQVHACPHWYALLHNSGTNALQALYYACQLVPGDEVIFPVYTFHATCSPAMHFGIKPVFCDASTDGNVSPAAIRRAITPRTKAVVVTHMWGLPCNMLEITSIIQKLPGIFLLEDCSHALGASIQGKMVGTFGDGAAWSLQGQKIVSGGECGVVLTKHANFHYRQLLLGHYNKRCKIEIPEGHYLREYALTGTGLKNRAHPLAVVIALNQLRKLRDFQRFKDFFANRLSDELSNIPFLEPICVRALRDSSIQHAWYAFVFRFKQDRAPLGLTRLIFVRELMDRGLEDIDIPKSTSLLHREPLFVRPQAILPHVAFTAPEERTISAPEYQNAQAFYDEAVKLPVWAFEDEAIIVDFYIDNIRAVARRWVVCEKL